MMQSITRALGGALLALTLAGTAQAVTVDIDFNSLDGAGSGTVLTTQFLNLGVVFSGVGSGATDDVLVRALSAFPGTGNSFRERNTADPVTLRFFDPTAPAVLAVTDFVRITLLDVEVAGNGFRAFGRNNQLLDTVFAPCVALDGCVQGDNPGAVVELELAVAGIHRIELFQPDGTDGDVVFDDLSFNPVVATVPLPAALPLLASGLALLGFAGWRRRARA